MKQTTKKLWYAKHDGFEFKSKEDLVEHLMNEFDDHTLIADMIVDQLETLGVDPYLPPPTKEETKPS